MSKTYKIQIKTHTPVRRPVSEWITKLYGNSIVYYHNRVRYSTIIKFEQDETIPKGDYSFANTTLTSSYPKPNDRPVITDISKGLENPLTTDRLQRDINAFRKKFPPIWPERKPSLLTRVKERFKR